MAPNPIAAPLPNPLTTAISPGFTLQGSNGGQQLSSAADAGNSANGEPAATLSHGGPATSPVPATGDSNPGPMAVSTDLSPGMSLQSSAASGRASGHPTQAPGPVILSNTSGGSGAMPTQLSPGMSVDSSGAVSSAAGTGNYPRPSGVVTAVRSSVPGLGTVGSTGTGTYGGGVMGASTGASMPGTDLSPGMTLASNAGMASASVTGGMGNESGSLFAQTTMPVASTAGATMGSMATVTSGMASTGGGAMTSGGMSAASSAARTTAGAAVSSAGASATSAAAGTSGGVMDASVPGMQVVVAVWAVMWGLGFWGRVRV